MNRLKLVLTVCAIYIVVVFSGTWLGMYLDSKFYGTRVYANDVQDDSEWHFKYWEQRKAALNYRIVFEFPEEDKTTKLVVVHDPVWDVYCYTLQNKPYYFKTGLNCFPRWVLEGGNAK